MAPLAPNKPKPNLVAAVLCHLLLAVLTAAGAASPPGSTTDADSLEIAAAWLEEGRFGDVEVLLRRLLPHLEEEFGPISAEVARGQDHLVTALWRTGRGQSTETLELAQQAVEIKREVLGPDHLELGESLFNLGILKAMGGNHAEADSLFLRVLTIREAALPANHPDLATTINALANVRRFAADYASALELYRRALEIMESSPSRPGLDVYSIRTSIATALGRLGRFAEAREILEETIRLQEESEHPHLPMSLNLLGNHLSFSERHEEARDAYRRALPLAEARGGPLDPWAVNIRGNLVVELTRLGAFAEARTLIEEQIERLESVNRETQDLARTYQRLANVLASLGDYAEALPLRQRSLEVYERVLAPGHPDIGEAMLNLAGTLGPLGRQDEQRDLIDRATLIFAERFDADSPDLIRFMDGLGEILYERGDLAEAQRILGQALQMRERIYGIDSPGVPQNLAGLARVARAAGENAKARALLERAVRLSTHHIGPQHPMTAAYALSLAWAEFATGNHEVAATLAAQAERILTPNLRLTLRALPERQALGYAGKRSGQVDLFLCLLDAWADPSMVGSAWDAVIRTRAIVQDEMAARTRRWTADDPDHDRLLGAFRRASGQLANLYLRGPGDEEPEIYRTLLDEARRNLEKSERDLADSRSNQPAGTSDRTIGLPEVEEALPDGCVLLAYSRYFVSPPVPGNSTKPAERYRAFVRGSASDATLSVALGDAKTIDNLIETWREEASVGLFASGRTPAQAAEVINQVGRALRAALWDPVAAHLTGARTVFLVPDGPIHLVNISALPLDSGTFLIEDGPLIHLLSAERDLVRMPEHEPVFASALVMGAPDFDLSVAPESGSPHPPVVHDLDPRQLGLFRGPRASGLDLLDRDFEALPGALQESDEVARFWRTRMEAQGAAVGEETVLLLTGADAREKTFKQRAPGRGLLHLATHGFVLEDAPEARLLAGHTNPLLLSGLALAGANRFSESDSEQEDGILTAQEIAALDLSAAHWAVLSACDTGTGSVQKGEGVLGLRRAFRIAGVGALISSLWAVEDEEGRQWMESFYRSISEDGLGTAEAVRTAGLSVLRGRRERGEDIHPFHWAGFLASGDWR